MKRWIVELEPNLSFKGKKLLVQIEADTDIKAVEIAGRTWGYRVTGVALLPPAPVETHSLRGEHVRVVTTEYEPTYTIESLR